MRTELEKPGNCITCGKFDEYRNTAGNCNSCHNAAAMQYRIDRKAWGEEGKKRGIKYWQERGVKIGDKVKTFAVAWFGLGGEEVVGTAKTGCNGAYVSSPFQRGKLAPNNWELA